MSGFHVSVDYISPSALGDLQRCEEYFRIKRVVGLEDPGTEATATGAGFAHALEFNDYEAGIAEYRANRPASDAFTDPELYANEGLVAEATIKWAWASYMQRYGRADFESSVKREITYLSPFGPTKTEGTLLCRLDGVGDSYVVEDKLRSGSSLASEKVEQEARNSHQLTAEIYAVWKKTGSLLPVQFRQMRKPHRTKTKALKTDASAIDYMIREHFETAENAYGLFIAERTVKDMKRFEAELTVSWERRKAIMGGKQAVRNPSACFQYGRMCPYADACLGGPA